MQFKVSILLLTIVGWSAVVNGNPILNAYADHFQLDSSVQTLFPVVEDLDRKLEKVSQCYVPELVGQQVDIFDREVSIKSIVDQYYKAFPEKTITKESIANLISSIRQITSACIQATESDTIRYGFTQLSDMSDAQIGTLTGAKPFNATQASTGDVTFMDGGNPRCRNGGAPIPADFDWRRHGAVTPIRNQGGCGSCWIFAVVESIESAYIIHHRADSSIDLSQQQLVDCVKANGCSGGYSYAAYEYVRTHGITTFHNYPYRANDNRCTGQGYPPAARIADYCVRSRFTYNGNYHAESLSDGAIIQALVNNGPLYILLNADSSWTRNYRGGIVNSPCATGINHAVQLVGYTPAAWILRNSWGNGWGEGGFFELARGRNLCGINTEIAWPIL